MLEKLFFLIVGEDGEDILKNVFIKMSIIEEKTLFFMALYNK